MSKTEDEIERERKAVQAMVGAKGAAEKVLARNDRLTARLRAVAGSLADLKGDVGDIYIQTYRHKERGKEGAHVMPLKTYLDAEIKLINELL